VTGVSGGGLVRARAILTAEVADRLIALLRAGNYFSGIHFRTADEVSTVNGNQVANLALDHRSAPTN
jgi:hypothetical protein